MSAYKQIDCGLHDVVEDRIVRRVVCEVVYRLEGDGVEQRYNGKLLDVYVRDGAEFILLEGEVTVRLDWVLRVDEVAFV
jgi:transcriptional antiterminator Rof (Rho-off)